MTILFNQFALPEQLITSLKRLHIDTPTPIQAEAISPALEGKDLLASAQTGTGKTLAYLLPLLNHLTTVDGSRALILAPTRELAMQIQSTINRLSYRNDIIKTVLLIGGDSMVKQLSLLKRSPRIVIGTPGRIIDHLDRKTLKIADINFLVLDETDKMLDMGFTEPLEKIIGQLPSERQTLMFSATLPTSIAKLSNKYLSNPLRITVGSVTQAASEIQQDTIKIRSAHKFDHLLKELDERTGSVIVFVKTKHGADQLALKLRDNQHSADAIHGDLRQRKREQIVKSFRNQKSRIMVATDVAARGLDIPHVMHVINYDLPQCPEDYIHRIGRTGRAGAKGFALSMISNEDNKKWALITRLMSGDANTTPYIPSKKSNNASRSGMKKGHNRGEVNFRRNTNKSEVNGTRTRSSKNDSDILDNDTKRSFPSFRKKATNESKKPGVVDFKRREDRFMKKNNNKAKPALKYKTV